MITSIQVRKSFFINPASPQEIFDIILSYDIKKSLGPNSIPIYILKISNNFLSDIFLVYLCLEKINFNSIQYENYLAFLGQCLFAKKTFLRIFKSHTFLTFFLHTHKM